MAIKWEPRTRIDIDPDAHKDYTFDFSSYIPDGETLVSAVGIGDENVTVDDVTVSGSGSEVTFWVSNVTENKTGMATIRITLSTGLINDFSLLFRGRHQ